MNWRIIEDDQVLPCFARASQNIAAVVALLRGLLEPMMPKDRWAHREVRTLLERAATQQAKSSLSRQRELNASQRTPRVWPDKDASIHQVPHGGRPRVTVLV